MAGISFGIKVELNTKEAEGILASIGRREGLLASELLAEITRTVPGVIGPKAVSLLKEIAASKIKRQRDGDMVDSITWKAGGGAAESGTSTNLLSVGYTPTSGGDELSGNPIIYVKAVEYGWTQRVGPPADRIAYYATGRGGDNLKPDERRRFKAIAKSMQGKTYTGKHTLLALQNDPRLDKIISDALKPLIARIWQFGGGRK